MRRILSILFVLSCFWASAQEASSSVHQSATLNQILSVKVLRAYQERSKSKIEDLFSYFQLLTDASLTADLKKEVINNIYLLFNNKDPQVVNLTSSNFESIPLSKLLQNLMKSKPLVFKIDNQTQFNNVTQDSWTTYYNLIINQSGKEMPIKLSQTIYFLNETKYFGNTSKSIQSSYLGCFKL
ncbi:hypothetical protein OX284_002720 [Flavobacterium sp. SUN046]|uniref:hypothetical protein n=1 Tax=Flavobacterium sp. SUN046 TaxID=3002440 RepID=UPI002DBBB813|nr:hypothetical protein [Flavobacterium sp. SUN046]MEC4048328.1 hypothetical protein [Flavobacterium sp. SUN046]